MYKRILTVQDISCVGQCSMTVALPILSACGHETCILPTTILSTHTGGFSKPVVHHMSDCIAEFWSHWKREGIQFDAIYTGYLGSAEAAEAIMTLSDEMLAEGGELIVDPAMADHGKVYSGLSAACVDAMMRLCEKADILIPNITEAAMLAGIPYQSSYDSDYIEALFRHQPCKKVILTGVSYENGKTGIEILNSDVRTYISHKKVGGNFHGTGDIFASCFTGARMRGKTLVDAVRIAAEFTVAAICNTVENPAHSYGVKFETALPDLINSL